MDARGSVAPSSFRAGQGCKPGALDVGEEGALICDAPAAEDSLEAAALGGRGAAMRFEAPGRFAVRRRLPRRSGRRGPRP